MSQIKQYGFAIIGCGGIARIHAEAIKGIDNARLIGVYDYNYESAKAFAESHETKAFKTLEKMLSQSDIQIVNICTPSGLHYKQVISAANAGKHVIVEKPMAITKAQMDEAMTAVKANGVKLQVISQLRFTTPIKLLKEAIDSGALGKIYIANFHMMYYRPHEYYASSRWRGTWEMDGGGALMNQGIHGIDLVQYVMGGVKSVTAQCRTLGRDIEVEDTANIILEYKNGAVGTIMATTLGKPGYPRRLAVYGEKGSIIVSEDTIEKWDVEGVPAPETIASRINSLAGNPNDFTEDYHKAQFVDLIDAIENEREPAVNMYEGKKAVDIILAAYESSETGKKIYL